MLKYLMQLIMLHIMVTMIQYYCLKKEFPAICSDHINYAHKYAAINGHNDTLMLLKKEFPDVIIDSENILDSVASYGHNIT